MLKEAIENMAAFVPVDGFNVVGVDDFESPGEQLYLVEHVDTEKEAQEVLNAFKTHHPEVEAYIYAPKGVMVEKSLQKFMDFTAPIIQQNNETYDRVKKILKRHGYTDKEFEEGGQFYGWSVNDLLDLVLEKNRK